MLVQERLSESMLSDVSRYQPGSDVKYIFLRSLYLILRVRSLRKQLSALLILRGVHLFVIQLLDKDVFESLKDYRQDATQKQRISLKHFSNDLTQQLFREDCMMLFENLELARASSRFWARVL